MSHKNALTIDPIRYRRRQITSIVAVSMAILGTLIGLFILAWILLTLFGRGGSALGLHVFTEMTPPPGSEGGLANAIVGTVMMVGLAAIIGIPIGILAGTWLAEYSRNSKLAQVIRYINDILLSAPSILIGMFVYEIAVVPAGGFSGFAGAISLIIIALPVVVRTAEDMLQLVPDSLREAAAALGCPRWRVITAVCWRAAGPGLMTGALLAIARISGETAPLLFTSLNNQFWSLDMTNSIGNLPVVIFEYAMSPYQDWQNLAWAGALLLTLSVLGLTIVARLVLTSRQGGRS